MNNEIKHNQWTVLTQKHSLISKAFFCRVFALCVFLTLSLLPITAQTNTQQSTPDYYSIAEAGVKKYYPNQSQYFEKIFSDIKNLWWYERYLLNEEIRITIGLEWLTNEKEITTTILISVEILSWQDVFIINSRIPRDDMKYKLWKEIANWFINSYSKQKRNVENFVKEIKVLNTKTNKEWINNNLNDIIQFCEKYMPLLKDWLLNYWELYDYDLAQDWIETYINAIKMANKKPSQIGQRYIDEYNKINKK